LKESLLGRKVVIESDRERVNAFVRETTYSLRTRPQTVRAIGIVTYHGIERIDFRVLRQGMETADRELSGTAVARTVKVVSHRYRRLQRIVSHFVGRAEVPGITLAVGATAIGAIPDAVQRGALAEVPGGAELVGIGSVSAGVVAQGLVAGRYVQRAVLITATDAGEILFGITAGDPQIVIGAVQRIRDLHFESGKIGRGIRDQIVGAIVEHARTADVADDGVIIGLGIGERIKAGGHNTINKNKAARRHHAEAAAQAHGGGAGSAECGAGIEIHLGLDLPQGAQAIAQVFVALEAQARHVARQGHRTILVRRIRIVVRDVVQRHARLT